MARMRIVLDADAKAKLSHADEFREAMDGIAARGAEHAREIAPVASGAYVAGIEGKTAEVKGEVHGQVWANDPISLQVEYGTGRPASGRSRPQGGDSPKFRVLGRTLLAMEGEADD